MEERLKELKKVLGLKNKDLAEILSVTPNAVTEVLKGRTKNIPTKWILALFDKFKINIHWLVTGHGPMFPLKDFPGEKLSSLRFLSETEQKDILAYTEFLKYKRELRNHAIETPNSGEALIPISILGSIAAGRPILAEENPEKTIYLPSNLFKKSGNIFGLRIRGNSMVDAGIYPDDIAIIRKTGNMLEIQNKDIVAILIDQEATLKYFIKENEKKILRSANLNYQDIELKPSDNPVIIGKLVFLFRDYQ